MNNRELYQAAKKALDNLFGDTSVSQAQCRANLQALMSEIRIMLSGLDEDGDAVDYEEDDE